MFALVFGEKWREAGIYAQILIFMMMLKMITSPLTYTFFIAGKLKEDFIYHVGILISIIVSLYIGLIYFDTNIALIFFSFSYAIWYFIYLFRSYNFSVYV